MTHYEERLERDLSLIREKLSGLAESVSTALELACRALFTSDEKLAHQVVLGDLPINRASRDLDKTCHRFFAVHLPSAGHLRFVSAVMRVNLELERIGDYAGTICKESTQIGHRPNQAIGTDLEQMATASRAILSQALQDFQEGNAEQARLNADKGREVTRGFERVFKALVEEEGRLPAAELLYYLVVFTRFCRVVDQARNICEETVFAITGEPKAPKSYQILFLDEGNSTLGPMAEAIARKHFPNSGVYSSAARQAAETLDPNLGSFLESRGISSNDLTPTALDPAADLSGFHVIVSLQGTVRSYVETIPYQTIALEWEVDGTPTSDGGATTEELEHLYRALVHQVEDLMATMHGDEVPPT
jgi:phosphate transport system protein